MSGVCEVCLSNKYCLVGRNQRFSFIVLRLAVRKADDVFPATALCGVQNIEVFLLFVAFIV